MAKTSQIVRVRRQKRKYLQALAAGRRMKFATRVYNRCERCGRVHGYIGMFEMCRICVRELAREGRLAGVVKSSW